MNSSRSVYGSIMGLSEFENYEFEHNWISILVLAMMAYSAVPFCIFWKTVYIFVKRREKFKQSSVRLEVVQSFLLMQFWNIVLVFADFSMFRIPYTTILTRYCASENPQLFLRTITFFYFWAVYCSQLFTALFCALRVAVMCSWSQETTRRIIKVVPPIIVLFGMIVAFPQLTTDSFCLRLPYPMLPESVLIISTFHIGNLPIIIFNLSIYLFVAIIIAFLNSLMLIKVRQTRNSIAVRFALQHAKVEKTLTGTMIILLFPLIVSLLISIGEILRNRYFAYILFARPFFLDARVHIVTCYFYFTHPIFKKAGCKTTCFCSMN